MDYTNKIVVITGASSGIGEESAAEFAKRKSKVVLISRNKQNLEVVAEKIKKYNSEILVYPCDVSKKDQVEQMSRTILEKFGKVDILVNNAGFGIYSLIHESKIEDIESQTATNYLGMVYCTKAFLPQMLEQKSGHIVNVASVAASLGIPGMAPYCASKFAMLGFSESLYHELKGTGVGITVVSPIMVRTNFLKHQSFNSFPKYSYMSLCSNSVAKAVIRASNSSRLEIIIPWFVRVAVWVKQTFPYIINPIVGAVFQKRMRKKHEI